MPARTKALRSKYNRKRRNDLKEQGLCVTCGWREVMPGRAQCQFCYDRWKASAEKSDPGRERARARQRELREQRIAAGICTECGKRPANPGRRMCERCRQMRNDSTRKYKINKKIERAVERARMKNHANGT